MIDEATIDCEENGFELVLTGDFADVFADYLAADPSTPAASTVRLRLPHDAALQLAAAARGTLLPWAEDFDRELAAYLRATPAERAAVLAGVSPEDVLVEELSEAVDLYRKAARENV